MIVVCILSSTMAIVWPYRSAAVFAYRGDLSNAMEWLERAYEQHDAQLVWSLVHPLNDNLKGDPRYEALIERLGLRG